MADPVTLGGLVVWGLGAATGGALGGVSDRGLCGVVAGLRNKATAWKGLPANHHVARAVQIAHAQALEVVIRDFRGTDSGGWATPPSAERAFYDETLAECRRLHRFAESAEKGNLQFDLNATLTGAIDAVLLAPNDGPAGARAAALKAGAEDHAMAAFRAILADRQLPEPPGFEAHFRSAEPGKGYVAGFGGFVSRQIKTNDPFRNIYVVEGLAEIEALGLDALTVMVRMEEAFLPALERIERQIGEGFAAARRDRDAKHRENISGHAETHRMLREMLAAAAGLEPENLRPLFEAVGREVPEAQFDEAVRTAVAELLARAERRPQAFNDPIEIQAAIEAARVKLRLLDPDGAIAILDRAEAEEQENVAARNRGRARMRVEKAEILKTVYRYDDALEAFAEAATLDPADPWPHFESGDIWKLRGNVTRALACYETGRDVAVEVGNERDLSVSHNKIGDVRVAQGRLEEAGRSYEATYEILERLAISDPSNAGLQRDLSVSHDRIGDVRVAQGRLEEAGRSYEAGLAIAERLAVSDPSNAGLQRDLSVSHNKIGDVRVAQGRLEEARRSYEADLEITERLAVFDRSHAGLQRDLIISNVKLAGIDADPVRRYGQALAIARDLAATGRLAPADQWMIPELKRLLREAGGLP